MNSLEVTLAEAARGQDTPALIGCLVKIHPLEISHGTLKIDSTLFTIGRSAECNLHLEDDSVSRRHAAIECLDNTYFVNDLDSTNGVFVNGTAVKHQELRAGDRLRFGNHIFKFLDEVEAQYHETVYAMMTRDGLTGSYNKRYFLDALERDIERCRRRHRPVSLIMMDIDHFKAINDTYGHLAGDEVLQELCQRIQDVARDDEIFARFGGEEFALLISDGDLNEAVGLARRCNEVVGSQPFETSTASIDVTLSLGVAEYDSSSNDDVTALLEAADSKLYEAKNSGRNQVAS